MVACPSRLTLIMMQLLSLTLLCSQSLSDVIPAKAGTHTPQPSKMAKPATVPPFGGYGSPPSRGRQEQMLCLPYVWCARTVISYSPTCSQLQLNTSTSMTELNRCG